MLAASGQGLSPDPSVPARGSAAVGSSSGDAPVPSTNVPCTDEEPSEPIVPEIEPETSLALADAAKPPISMAAENQIRIALCMTAGFLTSIRP